MSGAGLAALMVPRVVALDEITERAKVAPMAAVLMAPQLWVSQAERLKMVPS